MKDEQLEARELPEPSSGAKLSIGALSRATGIPVETLRTWENRYGFPIPERKPSGHRVYPLDAVPRLNRIAEAIAAGHRPGQVVGASDEDLSRLIATTSASSAPEAPAFVVPAGVDELLELVHTFDADRLTRVLMTDWARLDPVRFLDERIAPLVRAVGEAWATGKLGIRHEHFLSERVEDLTRTLRLRFEERASGPSIVLSSLPGETHGLGIQMAALVVAASGWTTVCLGPDMPVTEIAEIAHDVDAQAVGVSISIATKGAASATGLRRLRELLRPEIALIAGGDGAPKPRPGVDTVTDLRALDRWARAHLTPGTEARR